MRRKRDLSEDEKSKVVKNLSLGKTSLEISKMLTRDHRTIKKYIEDFSAQRRGYDIKGKQENYAAANDQN